MVAIDFFDRGWRQRPSHPAYIQADRRWTYQEAGELSCQIAHALLGDGYGRETKAAVLSPNDAEAWISVLAVWRAGLTWVPLNPAGTPSAIQAMIDGFDCEVLFFHSTTAAVVNELKPKLPKVQQYICLDADDVIEDAPSLHSWSADKPTTPPRVRYAMDDVAAINPTGGTTGVPKGVMNTHRSLSTCFVHLMMATAYRADEAIVTLVSAPMTHASGLLSMPVTARGGTVVILDKPDPMAVLDAIERHHVTELFLPPTVIYRLLETPGVEQRDYSSLRYLIYTSAPMSIEKLRRAIEVFGPVMLECYGQAEAPAGVAFMRPEEHFVDGVVATDGRLASCGRPYPLVAVEIQGSDGSSVAVGESGEICVRGDLVMKGYYNAPDKTAETIVDGWLHTGDIGHLDSNGYLFITDRKKDMIISGGFNVYPSEIEQVLWSHPAVQDCAVIGVPHSDWGEAVKAIVELNGSASVTEAELIALCKEKLGGIRTPKSIEFSDSLPRSANGKVLKKDLRASYWSHEHRQV